jgi:hypothetical protein
VPFCGTAEGRSDWILSQIFDKVSSSVVVNILHNKTFFFFPNEIAGGAKRRPLRFERGIRFARPAKAGLAVLQNEVSPFAILIFYFAQ